MAPRILLVALICFLLAPIRSEAEADSMGAITFSAVHLALPMLEGTVEIRDTDTSGYGLIAGLGLYDDSLAYSIGATSRWYLIGDFDQGLAFVVDGVIMSVADTDIEDGIIGSFLLGWKQTIGSSIVIEVHGGVQFSPAGIGPGVNANIGKAY